MLIERLLSFDILRCISTYRHSHLDEQAVFWQLLRTSADHKVLPIGSCRNFGNEEDLQEKEKLVRDGQHPLISCVLDVCMFNSGMLSKVPIQEESTYGTVLLECSFSSTF